MSDPIEEAHDWYEVNGDPLEKAVERLRYHKKSGHLVETVKGRKWDVVDRPPALGTPYVYVDGNGVAREFLNDGTSQFILRCPKE